MANSYFSFKQFTVQQEMAAMKVCTDACLFGAWVASTAKDAGHVLDIGTGTGLLSLMYAQRHLQCAIDAVEIDMPAANQANDNFSASPWASRLRVHHCPIGEFKQDVKYDLIITNPPFFEKDLPSVKEPRNIAMHDAALTLEALKECIQQLISPGGKLAVLLPYHRTGYFTELMQHSNWNLMSAVSVKQTPRHDYFRSMLLFSKQITDDTIYEEIVIKNEENNYSPEFAAFLKDYYLHL